jgi:hypothetical protein
MKGRKGRSVPIRNPDKEPIQRQERQMKNIPPEGIQMSPAIIPMIDTLDKKNLELSGKFQQSDQQFEMAKQAMIKEKNEIMQEQSKNSSTIYTLITTELEKLGIQVDMKNPPRYDTDRKLILPPRQIINLQDLMSNVKK